MTSTSTVAHVRSNFGRPRTAGSSSRNADADWGWLSPDGSRIVCRIDSYSTVALFDVESGRELRRMKGGYNAFLGGLRLDAPVYFSQDSSRVVLRDRENGKYWLLDTKTGNDVAALEGFGKENENYRVGTVNFSPDSRRLLLGGGLRVYDPRSGRELFRKDRAYVLALSPDHGKALYQSRRGDNDYKHAIVDLKTGSELVSLRFPKNWEYVETVFSPDGRQLLAINRLADADHSFFSTWDADTGHELRRFIGHGGWETKAAFSPDGRSIVSVEPYETLRLWDAATAQEIHRYEGFTGFRDLTLLRDGAFAYCRGFLQR